MLNSQSFRIMVFYLTVYCLSSAKGDAVREYDAPAVFRLTVYALTLQLGGKPFIVKPKIDFPAEKVSECGKHLVMRLKISFFYLSKRYSAGVGYPFGYG